ncbi:MAG TPA: nuclear transport factor 2 family protein [Thermoanaerobaculia bacterium]|nr:nuclear transport factor 2 family protein [Thermoanaerobaculia bacterium]
MHSSRPFRLLLAASVSLALGACASTTPAFDATAESAALMHRDAEWADLAAAGKDVERIVSYWTDDAVIMEPGQPAVEGKPAIRAYVASSFKTPGFRIHWVSRKPTFSPDGRMAYMRGADEMTLPGPTGDLTTLHLQGYSIWRKDSDGQWRCTVDIANEAPADPQPAVR